MLVKIKTSQLLLGMHVKEFVGPWLAHPFWRTSFLIENPEDLAKAKNSGVEEVWVDTSKGRSPEGGDAVCEPAEEGSGLSGPSDDAIRLEPMSPREGPVASHVKPADFADEAKRAEAICKRANAAVKKMFVDAASGRAVSLEEARPVVETITESIQRNSDALISVARQKERGEYATMHSVAVCALMVALSEKMGLGAEQADAAGLAGLLMDIGMARVPKEIVGKAGPLDEAEMAIAKKHALVGRDILALTPGMPQEALDACAGHHERVNGQGYPMGTSGAAMPRVAKMAAICDVYDAITSDRPYKSGLSPSEAMRAMAEWSRDNFDEEVFKSFVKTVGIYPVGAMVRLESKRLAVVCSQNKGALLMPMVKVFYSVSSGERLRPEMLDLSKKTDRIVAKEDPKLHKFGDLDALWRY